ncbi:MAG: hypothetical protein AAF658_05765 [Myxococcota bacterium]
MATSEPAKERPVCAGTGFDKRISISTKGADLVAVLAFIADEAQLNLVVDNDVSGTVTTELHNVRVRNALDALMATYGLDASIHDCVLTARMR